MRLGRKEEPLEIISSIYPVQVMYLGLVSTVLVVMYYNCSVKPWI